MLKSVAELRTAGDLRAINDLVPYARTVGLELLRDELGLFTALRFREGNIGNFVVRAIHGGVIGGLLATLRRPARGGFFVSQTKNFQVSVERGLRRLARSNCST